MKERYHSSPPMSTFYWQKAWHQPKKNIKKDQKGTPFPWGGMGKHILEHVASLSPLVFLRSSGIWWMFSPACLGWIWTGVSFAYQTPGTRKLTWNLNGDFVGGSEQQKKQQVLNKFGLWMDLGILVFHYTWQGRKCSIRTVLGWIWTGGHILSPRMLPLVRLSSIKPLCPLGVVVEPTTETNIEPNKFNFWGDQRQQIHHKIVTFVFLLLLVIVALSISFLVCWYLLSFHVAC